MTILIIAIITFLLVGTYAYYGGFNKVEVSTTQAGGELLVYEVMTGDFKQSGTVMDKVYYSLLNEDSIETFKGIGIYYQDPRKVEDKSALKSDIGCIIERGDYEKIRQLGSKYMMKEIPTQQYVTAEFPYKGKLSVFVSLMKVYPAIGKFLKENSYSEQGFVMEIYDMPNKRIIYRKEIVK